MFGSWNAFCCFSGACCGQKPILFSPRSDLGRRTQRIRGKRVEALDQSAPRQVHVFSDEKPWMSPEDRPARSVESRRSSGGLSSGVVGPGSGGSGSLWISSCRVGAPMVLYGSEEVSGSAG